MVFLSLCLNSLYEPPEREEESRCPVHPLRRRNSWESDVTFYTADLNVLLAHLNALDDWRDEHKPLKWAEAKLLSRSASEAAERNPRQWRSIQKSLSLLQDVESRRDPSPDAGANAFGTLMEELFVWREDRWEPALRSLGQNLGRVIYILDALTDRKKDERRGLYNPISLLMAQGATEAEIREILLNLAADAAAAWEVLPLVQDTSIQRNILYAGLWGRLPTLRRDQLP